MADDKVLKDAEDEELDIVEVAELPAPGAEVKKEEPSDDEEDDDSKPDDDDEEQEDARLADHEDDEEDGEHKDDPDSAARKKRLKRRQIQKQARDRTLNEVAELRRVNEELLRRVSGIEGAHLNFSETQIDARLTEVRRDIETAETILAKAIEAGNGADAATALRLRDEAKAAEADLVRNKSLFGEARKPKQETQDPEVSRYANAWKAANPWYGKPGSEVDSAIINAIDATLTAERYDPKSDEYWKELTRRANARINPEDKGSKRVTTDRKKPPPQGSSREHAPQSTRREVYVTPERKAAMVEAGIWDDPQRRSKMLKAYADYDRDNRSAG